MYTNERIRELFPTGCYVQFKQYKHTYQVEGWTPSSQSNIIRLLVRLRGHRSILDAVHCTRVPGPKTSYSLETLDEIIRSFRTNTERTYVNNPLAYNIHSLQN